jgi:hypothetical protein
MYNLTLAMWEKLNLQKKRQKIILALLFATEKVSRKLKDWDLIGADGPLRLVKIDGKLNSEKYEEILFDNIILLENLQDLCKMVILATQLLV